MEAARANTAKCTPRAVDSNCTSKGDSEEWDINVICAKNDLNPKQLFGLFEY